MTVDKGSDLLPRAVFQAPLLRGLDERGQRELSAASVLLQIAEGEAVYDAGDRGDWLYVVAEGEIALCGLVRGDETARELRIAAQGESFGEEAWVGASRRARAVAAGAAKVAKLPIQVLKRTLVRASGEQVAMRIERRLRRRATAELLSTMSLANLLPARDLEMLLDGARHQSVKRGETIFRVGDEATELWLVADGMVQLQTSDDEQIRVRAYLTLGDFFGDEEVFAKRVRSETAVASGDSLLIAVSSEVARSVSDRNRDVFRTLRRVAGKERDLQQEIVGDAAKNQTQHAFRDLYRLQVARSLLVIDLDSCVRCGHCAWSCESLHGVARLVRRGDKIVTSLQLLDQPQAKQAPLLIPNSCQHCASPACMPDCPTGAIGRDPRGEVYIRDATCTGCGACAKGCPWDNIQIVPRPAKGGEASIYESLAVKCDLCRDYEGPACVLGCPTESIFRLNPSEALPAVVSVLGGAGTTPRRARSSGASLQLSVVLASAVLALVGYHQHRIGAWQPFRSIGYGFGVLSAALYLALLAYAVPKRLMARRSKPRRTSLRQRPGLRSPDGETLGQSNQARSKLRPRLSLHLALGYLSLAAVVAHSGATFRFDTAGGALLAYLISAGCGLGAALSYWVVPGRLSRIERRASLPEDFGALRLELIDQLYGGVTGKSELVKRLFERVLLPYLRRPGGGLWLVLGGNTLASEQRSLSDRVEVMLEGRGKERLAGLEQLIKLVVELRALGAQRVLLMLLRMWLPLHIVAFCVAGLLVAAHIVEVLW